MLDKSDSLIVLNKMSLGSANRLARGIKELIGKNIEDISLDQLVQFRKTFGYRMKGVGQKTIEQLDYILKDLNEGL